MNNNNKSVNKLYYGDTLVNISVTNGGSGGDIPMPSGLSYLSLDDFGNPTAINIIVDGDYSYTVPSLTSVTWSGSATTIPSSAVTNNSVKKIYIGDNIKRIENYSFNNISSTHLIETFNISNNLEHIGEYSMPQVSYFDTSLLTAIDSVTYVDGLKLAFNSTSSSASSISEGCLYTYGIFSATHPTGSTVTLPSTLKIIGPLTFYNCTKLTSITIPNGVKNIGYSAFQGCTSLTSMEIPDSVTSIGQYAFNTCSGLTSCTIGSGVTSIGDYAFDSCKRLTSIEIPDSVTSIGQSVFKDCSGLTSITIGSGVTSIGNYAFNGCSGITSFDIPDNVTTIGNDAFKNCRATNYTFGTGLTNLSTMSRHTTTYATFTFKATTPPTISYNALGSITYIQHIYVPAESVDAYKTTYIWSNYASKIEAIPN